MSFKYQGNDLTTLFMPNKDDNTPDTNYYINGMDISGLFQAYFNGSNAVNIPYNINGTTNLSSLFQKIDVPLPQPSFGYTPEPLIFDDVIINSVTYKCLIISNDKNNYQIGDGITIYPNNRKIYLYAIGGGGGGASIGTFSTTNIPTGGTGGVYYKQIITSPVTQAFIGILQVGQGGLGGPINEAGSNGNPGTSTICSYIDNLGIPIEINVSGGDGGTTKYPPFLPNVQNTGTKLNPITTMGVGGTGGYYQSGLVSNGGGVYQSGGVNDNNSNDAIYYGGGGGAGGGFSDDTNTYSRKSGGKGFDGALIIIYAV